MVTQRRYLDLHKRVERERVEQVVEFGGALNVKDADVGVFSSNSPQMNPLAIHLEFFGPLVLLFAQLFQVLGIHIGRYADIDTNMKQHSALLVLALSLPLAVCKVLMHLDETGKPHQSIERTVANRDPHLIDAD
jgi:hypothetical protein